MAFIPDGVLYCDCFCEICETIAKHCAECDRVTEEQMEQLGRSE